MHRASVSLRRAALAVAALATAAVVTSSAEAQRTTGARVTPYVGYINFGDYADGPIGTRISNASSAIYGVGVGLDLARNVSLVGNIGYTDSNVRVGLPIIGGVNIADSKVLLYDGGLEFRLPGTSLGAGLVPWVQVGAGAIRYEVRSGPLTTNATNFAGNFGGGLDVRLNRSLGIRAGVKDYVGKFDFREATSFDLHNRVSHNVALTLGLTLGL
ncbi:MAG: outer membrane beta-barrel protein [Gemmatimonadota bacterium]